MLVLTTRCWRRSARPTAGLPGRTATMTWTRQAEQQLARLFGAEGGVFFVFTGTAANVLGLSLLLRPFEAVICAESAHLNVDECGAPERVLGAKLLTVATPDGKLTPGLIERRLGGRGDEHRAQPRVVAITQVTELGTCYTLDELRELVGVLPGPGAAAVPGRCPAGERGGASGLLAGRSGGERRRAQLRRDEERCGGRGGRRRDGSVDHRGGAVFCASSRCSWRRRCGSWRLSSWRCSRTSSGPGARGMRTRWLDGWRMRSVACREWMSVTRFSPMRCSPRWTRSTSRLFRRTGISVSGTPTTNVVRWMTAFDTTEA